MEKINWDERKAVYARSQLSMENILRYAKRVAHETKVPPSNNDHWVLMTRYSHDSFEERKSNYFYEEYFHKNYYFCLGTEGNLFVEEEAMGSRVKVMYDGLPGYNKDDGMPATRREVTEDDIMLFDWKPKESRSGTHGGMQKSGNIERSNVLLVHAKGVGLTKALKALLEN